MSLERNEIDFNHVGDLMKGKDKDISSIINRLNFDFLGPITPGILAKCDLCHNDPCMNGASCRPLPNR